MSCLPPSTPNGETFVEDCACNNCARLQTELDRLREDLERAHADLRRDVCACGCGDPVTKGARFIHGHNGRPRTPRWATEDKGFTTECWIWQGALDNCGYGVVRNPITGKAGRAHRVIWEKHNGPIPSRLQLDHLCRVRNCVNPDHLEPVTVAENLRRGRGAKLTREKVHEIRACLRAGETQSSIARRYGVAQNTISNIKHGRRWADV